MRYISIVSEFSTLVTPFTCILSGNSVHGGNDQSIGVAYFPPTYLISPPVFSVVRVCPILYRYFKRPQLKKKLNLKVNEINENAYENLQDASTNVLVTFVSG